VSETCSEDLRLRFDDSRVFVFEGITPEDVVSSAIERLLLVVLFLGAFGGAAEQLATATACILKDRYGEPERGE
jgi:hypothetical protein